MDRRTATIAHRNRKSKIPNQKSKFLLMSSEKSRAIVLRLVEFSETSLVVTLYTRDFGKIGALAKGARRPKERVRGRS